MTPAKSNPAPVVPAWQDQAQAQMRAHRMAIDRLCMNMLSGVPSLAGVAEEYSNALAIERAIPIQNKGGEPA